MVRITCLQLRTRLRQAVLQHRAAAAQRGHALAACDLQPGQQRVLGQRQGTQADAAGHVEGAQLWAARQRLAHVYGQENTD